MNNHQFWTTDQKPSDIGTFNPEALNQPIFQTHPKQSTIYDEIAKLSNYAEELQQKNLQLKEQCETYLNTPIHNSFVDYKIYETKLAGRIAEREAELDDFYKHFSDFRTSSTPTYVQVGASSSRSATFDPIKLSLIVSNDQKTFFKSGDIKDQNENLRLLITKQKESIDLLESRLRVFHNFQQTETIKGALQALSRGMTPGMLSNVAPTHILELRAKHKMLSNELNKLVKKRRSIQQHRIQKKLKRREMRLFNKSATLIQRFYRGYSLRKQLEIEHRSAKKIQICFRAYIARYKYHKILEEIRQREEDEEEDTVDQPEINQNHRQRDVTFI